MLARSNHSPKTKMEISSSLKRHLPRTAFKKGNVPWNKGKKMSEEYRERCRISHRKNGIQIGNKNRSLKRYLSIKKNWLNGVKVTKETWQKAEQLADTILLKEGFSEIFSTSAYRYYPFDKLCRKEGKLCAVDVTVSYSKYFDRFKIELSQFYNQRIFVLFVKPDFSKYRLMEVPLENPIHGIWADNKGRLMSEGEICEENSEGKISKQNNNMAQ